MPWGPNMRWALDASLSHTPASGSVQETDSWPGKPAPKVVSPGWGVQRVLGECRWALTWPGLGGEMPKGCDAYGESLGWESVGLEEGLTRPALRERGQPQWGPQMGQGAVHPFHGAPRRRPCPSPWEGTGCWQGSLGPTLWAAGVCKDFRLQDRPAGDLIATAASVQRMGLKAVILKVWPGEPEDLWDPFRESSRSKLFSY